MKSILPLLLVIGMVGAAQAQSVNNTMTGTAQLVDNITIDPATGDSASVDFGQVLTNVTSAIFLDPKGVNNTNVSGDASIGVFKVGGSPSTSVTIGYTEDVGMTGATGGNTYALSWLPALTYNQSNPASASGSSALTDGQSLNLNANDLHLYIGGNLVETGGDISSPFANNGAPTPDTYSGDVTSTVTIN
jgi:hypothetical protein